MSGPAVVLVWAVSSPLLLVLLLVVDERMALARRRRRRATRAAAAPALDRRGERVPRLAAARRPRPALTPRRAS